MRKTITSFATGVVQQGESKDCVVRAMANTLELPYAHVHSVLKKHGRKDRKGTYLHTSFAAASELGLALVGICGNTSSARESRRIAKNYYDHVAQFDGVTLGKFVEKFKTGEFVVFVRGHALSIINGKVIDTFDNVYSQRISVIWIKL